MAILPHKVWADAVLNGPVQQKGFRIYEGGNPNDILITMYQSQNQVPEGSNAEPGSWSVSVAYKSAPDEYLFQHSYLTDRQAKGVFDDLVNAAANCEGLVRQEKFDEAAEATQKLMDKFKANSSDTPNETKQ